MTHPLRWVAAALLGLVVVMPAAPVSAHTVLTSCQPPADAVLDVGPDRVSATFNERLQPTFAAMTVIGPDGNLWSDGNVEVRGTVVGVGLRPLGPSGRYTVNYRVTSADGHVVSGSWAFSLTSAGAGNPGPAVSAPPQRHRIALWPFVVGGIVLALGTAAWVRRVRS